MHKKHFLLILESALLKFGGMEEGEIYSKLGNNGNRKFVLTGLKLCDYLKSLEVLNK